MKEKKNFLEELNEQQKSAVLNINGPTLVVAGAGSGKTFVLVEHIIYLIKDLTFNFNCIRATIFNKKTSIFYCLRI